MKRLITGIKKEKLLRVLNFAYMVFMIIMMMSSTVLADDIWAKAEEIMMDIYKKILLISTVAAVVTSSIALLLMNFSKSGKTVDESRAWLKRIAITWAVLNSLGFILSYIVPFFEGGQWAGVNGGEAQVVE
jgi:hypothetical protein